MANAVGRGWRKPRVRIIPEASGARFRVDDDDNPELWLEVRVSNAELRELLGEGEQLGDDEHWERENPNACAD
jgi:hypothetical protein